PRPYLTSSLAPRGGRGPRRVRGLVVVHGVWCSWHVASPRRHLGSTTVTSPSRAGAPAALCPLRTRGYGNDHRTPRNARVFSLGRHLKRFSMFLSRVSRSRLWHESLLGRSTHPHRALRRFRPGRHRGRQTVRGQPQNGGALRQAAARAGWLGAQEASRAPAHPERSAGGGTPREP